MGLKLDKLKKNPVQFLSLTGFTAEEFDELAIEFRIEWDQYSSQFTLDGKPRQRIALPRKTNVLPVVNQLMIYPGKYQSVTLLADKVALISGGMKLGVVF
jgi:hypothetical protein